jgi:hypothetical protein
VGPDGKLSGRTMTAKGKPASQVRVAIIPISPYAPNLACMRSSSTTSLARSGMRCCSCPAVNSVDVPVGLYTGVMGLGASPDATKIAGNTHADANHEHNDATTTFWRGAQESRSRRRPARCSGRFRRRSATSMHVRRGLVLHQHHGWASGGWMSDSIVDGNIDSGSHQQWISHNCDWKSCTGSNWNMCSSA